MFIQRDGSRLLRMLLAHFRLFKDDEFMSVTARKAEVISEKSENSNSMSVMRELSGLHFQHPKRAAHDP